MFADFVKTRKYTPVSRYCDVPHFLYAESLVIEICSNGQFMLALNSSSWMSYDLHALEADLYSYGVQEGHVT